MGFELKDLAGISKPAEKLITTVSQGIGTIFRPAAIRREADARAYEIRTIANAQADAGVIAATGQSRAELSRIETLAVENPELVERARMRLLSREIEGQINVEAIAEEGLKALPAEVSDVPVDANWRRKFFQEAENICDQDLQLFWGKVLAGEVTAPGSYSLRTLEVLRRLSKEEAELFQKACRLAFNDGWIMLPGKDINSLLKPYGIGYGALMSLREAGLLTEGDNLSKIFDFSNFGNASVVTNSVVYINNGIYVELSGPTLQGARIPSLPFARAGKELQRLIEPSPEYDYLRAVGLYLRGRGITVKKGAITETEAGQAVMTFDEDL